MNRGEIYYIHGTPTVGAEIEIKKARPAVIVSNNSLTHNSGAVEVVFLTTAPKREMPTHVCINATGVPSTALCEQINTVALQRVGDCAGVCTKEEMAAIDKALLASLGIGEQIGIDAQTKETTKLSEGAQWMSDQLNKVISELSRVTAERDRYAKMVDVMLQVTEV